LYEKIGDLMVERELDAKVRCMSRMARLSPIDSAEADLLIVAQGHDA
jgi:hypothetical protein